MRGAVAAGFRTTLAAYADPTALVLFAAAWLPAFAILLVPGSAEPVEAFGERVAWLAPLLLAPAMVTAFRLRGAWPALGPEDPGLVWLHGLAVPAWQPRLGAFLASLAGLAMLSVLGAALLLAWLAAAPGRPPLHEAERLQAMAPRDAPGAPVETLLARPGDREEFELPATTGAGELSLRPRWLLGERQPTSLLLGLGRRGGGEPLVLGSVVVPDVGREVRLPLPAAAAEGGRLRVVRESQPGSRLSLVLGELWRLGPELGTPTVALRVLVASLPAALVLLAAAWLASLALGPALARLAVLVLTPTVLLLLPAPLAGIAEARVEAGGSVTPWLAPMALALAAAVVLPRPLRLEDEP
ncbi:MAG: hypothetical protein R3F30_08755 [Planctomycetota bacterium]